MNSFFREFIKFAIDFNADFHETAKVWDADVKTFALDQHKLLKKSREIFKIVIQEHPILHQEHCNANKNQGWLLHGQGWLHSSLVSTS